ncbi:MAG: hypothetical protein WBX50_01845 [Candidatus Deferrimicrobiaceae bacterium]
MDHLTESEKTLFDSFAFVAKKPYLGMLAGGVLFFLGLWFYSQGMQNDRSDKTLLAGFLFGVGIFEIIESYLAYRLYAIFEKMKRPTA